MYSRGNNAYGQQSYAGQSAYGQNLGNAYSGNSVGGPDGGTQVPMVSRHSSMLGGAEEVDAGGYRAIPSTAAHYGGQYSSLYGSAALSTATQVPPMNAKGSGTSILESRGGYASAKPDSPKFSSGDYVSSSSHGYGHKSDQLYGEKATDYSAIDRRQFGERQSAYMGRDLQGEPTGRYADSIGFGPQHQSEIYDRIDKAVLLRQEQLLKSQSLQSGSLDGSARQADYLAARGAASRHPTQELSSFGGRIDADPRSLSMLSGSSYGGQPAPSILGAAPRRNVDDLMFSQSSSNPGYGVSLPPGRDYASGKALRGPSLESDYPGSLSHGGHPRIDERKDDRASYLQEFELREEARRRERLRERERDREREKDWERERERERGRERILERRMKERERDRKRAIETRRERTPPRVSKDRRGSSLAKEGRSLRRDSPHHEALHRRHSPVKDKRREYACKVYSTSLMDVERDYLAIDKRYPRLFIPSEFCKAVVNWPRENLHLSIHTPVSFEHDFVEEESAAELKEPATELLVEEPEKSGRGNIVWNAKIILMSGLSKNALEELSSERGSDDRLSHICNILRFAVLKKDRSCMAIGGPWSPADGGDPSVDESSLVQTALRYGKDAANLDLQNCKNWNRFLEIHYDRIGKDGFFSHKEVTVIFIPDLSECLPSLDSWRDQWLAHKKAVSERERQLSLKKEKLWEKEGLKDKEAESSKHRKGDKDDRKKESTSTGDAKDVKKMEQDGNKVKGNASEGKGDMNDKKPEKKDESGGDKGRIDDEKEQVETAEVQTTGTVKTGRKKIIKKVVRQKVVAKLATDSTTKQPDNVGGGTKGNQETPGQEEESSADPAAVKTFVRKKVVKKVPVGKAAVKEDGTGTKVKVEKETGCSEDKPYPSGSTNNSGKTIVKKKIIKRVPKRKVTDVGLNEGVSKSKKHGDGYEENVFADETGSTSKKTTKAEEPASDVVEAEKKVIVKPKASKTQVGDKQNDVANSSGADAKDVKEDIKDEKGAGEKSGSVTKMESEPDTQKVSPKDNNGMRKKLKDAEKTKDEKEKKDRDGKDESRSKSNKELKEMRKPEEPPRHPGLILQTKWSKDSKLRSSSLSLDLLLDYNDKDIEESTFEVSLFAETLYEMFQYQMGCRLLTFLQKLRIKFVTKRNQRKRQREVEKVEKGTDEKLPTKRQKVNDSPVKSQPVKSSETLSSSQPEGEKQDEGKTVTKENSSVDPVDEVKSEHMGDEEEEDPEEDPEECEEMEDASPQNHSSNENNEETNEEGKSDVNPVPGNEKDEVNVKVQANTKTEETKAKLEADTVEKREGKVVAEKKETTSAKEVVVDKELLQAFRFFDRNQVGYIRVEDLRLIIHNLGKFLSHRDVKELVQSALLESNTGRDDHILYKKLVRMIDI